MAGKVIILNGGDDTERRQYAAVWYSADTESRRVTGNVDQAFSFAQYGFEVILNNGRLAKRDIELLDVTKIKEVKNKKEEK